jgi:predicted enzyme related to lactoylglutathione lyase
MTDAPHPVAWFEIPVKQMARAKAFYEHVLGTTLESMQMGPADMAMFPSAQGPVGCLIQSDGYTPSQAGTLLYFGVADIAGTLARAESRGGKTLLPKMSIGEFGAVAHFEDCEGNRVALHSQS